MEKQKLMSFGLMVILVIGIIFISGCVQEESPTKAPTTQPSI
jgi:PBP1b-binding outer membrane lipoprotein LpoB